MRRPKLTHGTILRWAGAYRARTGRWPTNLSGRIPDSPGDTWNAIDMALRQGLRGLRRGGSLSQLLKRRRGLKRNSWVPPLTERLIVRWARRHCKRTGRWPTVHSGPVAESPGITWGNVHECLRVGWRVLPGGTTLSQLLAPLKAADRPPAPDPEPSTLPGPAFTVEGILAWADAWHARTSRWPTRRDGPIPERRDLTWLAVNQSLRLGRHGLPGGSSLPRLLHEYRGRRHKHDQRRLTEETILAWADAWHSRTGKWPGVQSGEIPRTGGEMWRPVNYALYIGLRGLPGGDSLRRLLKRAGRRG
jgi:hypothetical protein